MTATTGYYFIVTGERVDPDRWEIFGVTNNYSYAVSDQFTRHAGHEFVTTSLRICQAHNLEAVLKILLKQYPVGCEEYRRLYCQ